MPTFFVNLVILYRDGFNLIDEFDDEVKTKFLTIRKNLMENLLEKQFTLSYFTNMSLSDIKSLTPFELDSYIELLIEQKNIENNK